MSKLVLSGDTSGSVTLDAPSVSGTKEDIVLAAPIKFAAERQAEEIT